MHYLTHLTLRSSVILCIGLAAFGFLPGAFGNDDDDNTEEFSSDDDDSTGYSSSAHDYLPSSASSSPLATPFSSSPTGSSSTTASSSSSVPSSPPPAFVLTSSSSSTDSFSGHDTLTSSSQPTTPIEGNEAIIHSFLESIGVTGDARHQLLTSFRQDPNQHFSFPHARRPMPLLHRVIESFPIQEPLTVDHFSLLNALFETAGEQIRINSQDDWGNTPAHIAAVRLLPKLIEFLKVREANFHITNLRGMTPSSILEIAERFCLECSRISLILGPLSRDFGTHSSACVHEALLAALMPPPSSNTSICSSSSLSLPSDQPSSSEASSSSTSVSSSSVIPNSSTTCCSSPHTPRFPISICPSPLEVASNGLASVLILCVLYWYITSLSSLHSGL